ncbi:MAG: FkbM family methyltransferase [Opitutae bacterium]|nr:FkbM family methyltransferase [Opitutae bacterium]
MQGKFKRIVENFLFSIPRFYSTFYRSRGNWNLDKYIFLSLVRPGYIVVDGGANIGDYTQIFSRIVGASGQVLSFELAPPTLEKLKSNIQSWRLLNVKTFSCALSNKNEQAIIQLPGGVSGYASLSSHTEAWGDSPVESFNVETCRLDDFAQFSFDRLDFMKLDLEGAEPLAVEGASSILSRFLPSLHVEFSPLFMKDFDYGIEEFLDKLSDIGYDTLIGFTDRETPPVIIDREMRESGNIEAGGYTLVCLNNNKHTSEISLIIRPIA